MLHPFFLGSGTMAVEGFNPAPITLPPPPPLVGSVETARMAAMSWSKISFTLEPDLACKIARRATTSVYMHHVYKVRNV